MAMDREEVSMEAARCGVTGTPTFFVGNYVVVGAQLYKASGQTALRAGARRRGVEPGQDG